eukprot:TRINITY_DN44999_c0_g1_i1.p1 TRINITY_DN44999_c0_g1~~TRINITY_DN44999_c0_g1_i1.p1  ORF type:complete len:397 (-),score=63.50 TRINITY_DN44999_c0_g1_i1:188-1273(-)
MLSDVNLKHSGQVRTSTSGSDESFENDSRWSARRLALGGFGAAALIGCVIVALSSSRSVSQNHGVITARMLLDNPAVHAVASDNLLSFNTVDGVQEETLRARIGDNIRSIGVVIDTKLPRLSHVMQSVSITEDQVRAVLRAMQYMRDPRVQLVGLDVAHVIRDANTTDPTALRVLINERLSSRMRELKPLVEELMQGLLVIPFSETSTSLDGILEPSRIELLKTASDSWTDQLTIHAEAPIGKRSSPRLLLEKRNPTEKEQMRTSQQAIGSVGAAFEEVMSIFRIIQPITTLFGKNIDLPPLVISIIGALDFALEVTSCALGAASRGESMKSIVCPAMFASAGFDALRAIAVMLGYIDEFD